MLDVATPVHDPLAELERLNEGIPSAQEREKFGVQLTVVGTWLQQQAGSFSKFVDMCSACGDLRHAATAQDRAAVREHLVAILDFAKALADAADGERLDEAKELFGVTRQRVVQVQATLRRVCAAIVASDFIPLRTTGELISDLDPSSTLGQRLVAFSTRVVGLENVEPDVFAGRIRAALAEAEGYRAEIERLVHDPEQKAFMTALVEGRATLNLVTPAILEWLDRLQARDRFDVKPHAKAR